MRIGIEKNVFCFGLNVAIEMVISKRKRFGFWEDEMVGWNCKSFNVLEKFCVFV